MRKVESSNIAGFDWVPYGNEPPFDEGGELHVEFKNGRTYFYADVPAEIADRLNDIADEGGSIGSYFSREIRNNFAAVEVTE